MERQFAALAGPRDAKKRARQMLVRLQGASVLANVFSDEAWLFEEQQNIAEWLKALAADTPSDRG